MSAPGETLQAIRERAVTVKTVSGESLVDWARAGDDDRKTLLAEVDRLTASLSSAERDRDRMRETIEACIDMTVNCSGVPQNPDSLPQMVLHALKSALSPAPNATEAKK